MNQISIKFIYMLKLHPKQNINYQLKKRKRIDVNYFNDFKAFIEYLNNIDHIYKNAEKYNPNKKRKILIVFDDIMADMFSNEKLSPTVIY